MSLYLIKAPRWLKWLYPGFTWNMSRRQKAIYLTFDDGPTPEITPWVLDLLKEKGIKATFFLIGKNVHAHPDICRRIMDEGHAVGNHTYNHLNGWYSDHAIYIENVTCCDPLLHTSLFRPPYGKIKRRQGKTLLKKGYRIIMWDVISADYDRKNSAEQCYHNVIDHAENGSVIVFHDSRKAWPNMKDSLVRVIDHLLDEGFYFERIEADKIQ